MGIQKIKEPESVAVHENGRAPNAEEVAKFAEQLRVKNECWQQGRDVNRRRRREERRRAGFE